MESREFEREHLEIDHVEIEHDFRIESARFLPHAATSNPCSRMHGHSFLVRLRFAGPLDPKSEWLLDFAEIRQHAEPLLRELDHRVLNDIKGLENPTSENLCRYLYRQLKSRLPLLIQVEVSETSMTRCRYPRN
ncbi:MAG: 6-carboxytetrahydropterin synthase QueD [Bdellovibrio sp.]|nr:MAG: 6-carboxytetrahydropterin synthase QueD [Bdellovibrio sp.]